MSRLAILGASGHGKVVADAAECAGWKEIVFYDDNWQTYTFDSAWEVIGGTKELIKVLGKYDGVIVAIGDNLTRLIKLALLFDKGTNVISVIHPNATVSKYSNVGLGTVIMAGVVVNAGTDIGMGCIINTGASIDHDCVLADGVHVSPGAHLAGGVKIGEYSWVGIGSSINQQIQVGSHTIIGAGAAVIKDIPEHSTVVGVPGDIR